MAEEHSHGDILASVEFQNAVLGIVIPLLRERDKRRPKVIIDLDSDQTLWPRIDHPPVAYEVRHQLISLSEKQAFIEAGLQDFNWRLTAVEERMLGIEQRLRVVELDKAVEAFVLDRAASLDQLPGSSEPTQSVPSDTAHVWQDTFSKISRADSQSLIERFSLFEEAQSRIQEHVEEIGKQLDGVRTSIAFEGVQRDRSIRQTAEVAPMTVGLNTDASQPDCDPRRPTQTVTTRISCEDVAVENSAIYPNASNRITSATQRTRSARMVAATQRTRSASARESITLSTELPERVEAKFSSPLESSVWELVIIVGFRGVPMMENIIAVALIASNAVLQILVCVILMSKFTVNEEQAVQSWRFELGHWEKYASSSGRSMVDRLCNNDRTLELSGVQRTVFDDVQSWLSPFAGSYSGFSLVLWCLLIYFLFIWREIQLSCDRLTCTIEIPRGVWTTISPTEYGFRLCSMSSSRKVATVCVNLLRVGVALAIAYAGSVWLARTMALEDLLLNSVALVIVLDIDDMLFQTACPLTMKVMIDVLDPLPQARYAKLRTLRSFVTIVGCMGFLFCVYHTQLVGQLDEIQRLDTSFCGGRTNFVVGVNAVTDIVISYERNSNQASKSLMRNVAEDLAASIQKKNHIRAASWSAFRSLVLMDETTSVAAYGKCSDMFPEDEFLLAPLRQNINSSVSSCRDMGAEQCTGTSAIIRLACPVTCGCDRPRAGSFSLAGCPMQLCTSRKQYQVVLENERTADVHVDILIGMHDWHLYWDGFVRFASDRPGFGGIGGLPPASIATTFRQIGCEGVAFLHNTTTAGTSIDFFCSEQYTLRRPLRSYCPWSCNCSSLATASDVFCPKPPTSPILSCASILVDMMHSGSHPNQSRPTVATSNCSQNVSSSAEPLGWYKCRPFGYNRKHEYIFSNLGMQWIIRWETSSNLDWGATYLGAAIGLNGNPMWTLSSMKMGQIAFGERRIASRWFNPSRSTLPPEDGWLPRNASNSDADCAWHQIRVRGASDFVMTPPGASACPSNYSVIKTSRMCQNAAQLVSIPYAGAESDPLYPAGCYAWPERVSAQVYFNLHPVGLPAEAKSARICRTNHTT